MNGTFKDVEIFTEAPLGCHRGGKERNDIKCEMYIKYRLCTPPEGFVGLDFGRRKMSLMVTYITA